MARDRHDREIDYLRISVTDGCNLGCIYCVPSRRGARFGRDEVLTRDEIVRIVRAARTLGVRKVRLTGGEPLTRPDIAEVVRGVAGEGVRDVSLTTNGILLAGMARALREAGLGRVNVSLDSLDAGRYREITGGGRRREAPFEIERVREGIAAAEEAGLVPIKINMVPIRGLNDDEVVEFARLTIDRPWHVRFIEFMPSGRRDLWSSEKCVRTAEIKVRIEAGLGPLRERPFRGQGPSRNYVAEGAAGVIGFISPVSHEFCYACNRLRINAVGRVRPCLFSKSGIDIRGLLRSGCSDGDLARALEEAVAMKPEGGFLRDDPAASALDDMSRIGG
jgi:cyclic pyranopterin phosphate synthase